MNHLKRWMIALDFTLMDKTLINYAAFLSEYIKPGKIYFINIQRDMYVPESIRKNFPELRKPMDEKLQQEMKAEVERNFKNHELFDIEYVVIEGSPFEEMLSWSNIKNIDLLIVGRKSELKGTGIVSHRLARKVMCSVLFVPEKASLKLEKIFVPTDFSDNSLLAMQETIALTAHDPEAIIYCQHIYHLPSGYYTTGKTEEEFSEIMKNHAVNKYNKLLEDIKAKDIKITPIFNLDTNLSPANLINQTAHMKEADIIVMGARGRTTTTAILLGSVTEKLIQLDSDIPLLVVKQKDKTFNFAELLKTV